MAKLKVLDFWGKDFWKRHLKVFGFLQIFFLHLIDFIKDQMHSPELSVIIAGNYMINLNANMLGLYQSFALCEPLFPNDLNVPNVLMIENVFSRYTHHFYFLTFIGNLKKAPLLITITCSMFCFYDFILVFVDVIVIKAIFCNSSKGKLANYSEVIIYAYFRLTLTAFIVFYWLVVLFIPKSISKYIQVFSFPGIPINYTLRKIFTCRIFKNHHQVFMADFTFPIRIKAAGMIAFGLCTTNIIILIYFYKIYNLIEKLQSYLDYLRQQPYESIFIYIELKTLYTFTVDWGRHTLRLIIDLLIPIYPCLVVGCICGFLISIVSIFNLFYSYKRIILKIRAEGEDGEYLKEIWKFKTYDSIFFCTQFIISCLFLSYIFSFTVFITCYALSFKESQTLAIEYIKSRPASFWVALIPTMLGTFYFPFLNDKYNFIKNQNYFSMIDTWYFLICTIGALIKASFRYLISLGSILLLGFRVHVSIMPTPLDKLDTLFCGFYGCIVMQCLKDGIIPTGIRLQLAQEEPIYSNKMIKIHTS